MLIVLTSRNLLLVVLFAGAVLQLVRLYRGALTHDLDEHEPDEQPTSWPLKAQLS
jgi:hypothetical protein